MALTVQERGAADVDEVPRRRRWWVQEEVHDSRASGVNGLAASVVSPSRRRLSFGHMVTVSALYFYPVKSLRGLSVPRAVVTDRGSSMTAASWSWTTQVGSSPSARCHG